MKWRIKGPSGGTPFSEAAKIIISKKIKLLVKSIRLYFREENVKNLHEVRIDIRRLRYSLEVFFSCFEKKIFTSFYNRIEHLQDISGEVRDMDVMQETLLLFREGNGKVSPVFLEKLKSLRSEKNDELILELMKFIHGKEIKDFKNQL